MTFRLRLALVAALTVAATIAVASAVVYVVMRNELRTSVDHQLQQQSQQVLSNRGFLSHSFMNQPFAVPQHGPSATAMYLQLVVDTGFTQLAANETARFLSTTATRGRGTTAQPVLHERGGRQKVSRIYTVYVGR